MKKRTSAAALGCALLAAACGTSMQAGAAAGMGGSDAVIRNAQGQSVGTLRVEPHRQGTRVMATVTGMPPGTHGAHLHTVGRCDAPDFTTAGPHWNPTNKQHGLQNPNGWHLGDLPNLVVGADGTGRVEGVIAVPYGQGQGMMDADGTAFVVHASADDMRTDPSGNSGARIACAVAGGM